MSIIFTCVVSGGLSRFHDLRDGYWWNSSVGHPFEGPCRFLRMLVFWMTYKGRVSFTAQHMYASRISMLCQE